MNEGEIQGKDMIIVSMLMLERTSGLTMIRKGYNCVVLQLLTSEF